MTDSIKINDQRRFDVDGTLKSETAASGSSVSEPRPTPTTGIPDIDFSTFIVSLASSVQICLGVVPHPLSQKIEKDLQNAKQTINILGLLEEKTKGNLKPDEAQLLQQILYQLRLQFVEVSKNKTES